MAGCGVCRTCCDAGYCQPAQACGYYSVTDELIVTWPLGGSGPCDSGMKPWPAGGDIFHVSRACIGRCQCKDKYDTYQRKRIRTTNNTNHCITVQWYRVNYVIDFWYGTPMPNCKIRYASGMGDYGVLDPNSSPTAWFWCYLYPGAWFDWCIYTAVAGDGDCCPDGNYYYGKMPTAVMYAWYQVWCNSDNYDCYAWPWHDYGLSGCPPCTA